MSHVSLDSLHPGFECYFLLNVRKRINTDTVTITKSKYKTDGRRENAMNLSER